jgi:hypothetical protein
MEIREEPIETRPKKIPKEKFIRCDCYSHALLISKDEDLPVIYVSYYTVMPYRESFFHRLQRAYAELKDERWKDDLVFGEDRIIEMRDFLNEILEDIKNESKE